MSEEKPVHITQLEVRDVMGIKFVRIDLGIGLNLFTGKNGQGKSSLLKAIPAVLGGAKNAPKEGLRRGARRGYVKVKLSDLRTVVGNWNDENTRRITLLDANGNEIKSPQKQLDALIGELTFNPLAFLEADEKRQAEIYRQLGGLDFSGMDAERKRIFDERTDINRAVARENGVINALPFYPDVPKVELSFPELTERLNECHRINAANDKIRQEARAVALEHKEAEKKAAKAIADVAKLREALRLAEDAHLTAAADVGNKQAALRDAEEACKNLPVPEIWAVQEQIAAAAGINEKIRANANREAAIDRVREFEEEAQALTDQIDDLDAERLARLKAAEAAMPVKGLSMDGKTMLWRGLPLDQASGAEQIDFCVEIGVALHPGLNTVLIDDIEKMNRDRLDQLATKAIAMGLQVIATKATEGEDDSEGIVIEDGEVKRWDRGEAATVGPADDDFPGFEY